MSLSGLARLVIATVSRTVIRSYFPFFRSCCFRRSMRKNDQRMRFPMNLKLYKQNKAKYTNTEWKSHDKFLLIFSLSWHFSNWKEVAFIK